MLLADLRIAMVTEAQGPPVGGGVLSKGLTRGFSIPPPSLVSQKSIT